jgi:5-methylphenazine-1-carboxylate 1-monooxygenase
MSSTGRWSGCWISVDGVEGTGIRVLIAGGGIGGLTAALCLHRQGFDVHVYEAVDRLEPLGVGINLLPHGAEVLHDLGIGAQLAETGIRTRAIEYRTRFGHVLASEARGVEAGFRYPQYSIHRGHLQMLLLDAVRERLGSDRVHLGYALDSFEQTADSVTSYFAGASTAPATGDLLVGADGFHSAVRRQLHPDEGPAHYEGMLLRRGVREQEPFGDGRTMFVAGNHDLKVVCYPISEQARRDGRSLVNWVAEIRTDEPRSAEDADWNRVGGRDFIAEYRGFSMPDLDLIGLMEGTDRILEYPMIDRDPLPWWTQGRVTLLGDAAHPMLPIGANGASQAILDAAALERALAGERDVQRALAAYEAERRETTATVVLSNRGYGPERVLDIADSRLTGPDDRVEDLITPAEAEDVARTYRVVAGFKKATD